MIVEEREPGVWSIRVGEFIPDNERWLLEPEVQQKLKKALDWDSKHKTQVSDLDELEKKLGLKA